MFNKVLVPYDGSVFSDKALETAKGMAEAYGVQLLVLNVVPVPGVTAASAQEITDSGKLTTNEVIEKAKAKLGDMAAKAEYKVAMGNAAKTILNVGMLEQCKLIIMGSRGLTGFSELLMGSVSTKVVQLAKIPVMVVK